MRKRPAILYLDMVPGEPIQEMKLAGMRRYAAARQWDVEPIRLGAWRPEDIPRHFARLRPAGCIVESNMGGGNWPPRLFGDTPVVYLDAPRGLHRGRIVRVVADEESIVRAAMRELASTRPAAYAFVGFRFATPWSRTRLAAFRALVKESGLPCRVFLHRREEGDGSPPPDVEGIAAWLRSLPSQSAVFAVNDWTAADVAQAARIAGIRIPRDLVLVGVDNNEIYSTTSDPPVSTVQLDFERAGYLAARALATGRSAVYGPMMVIRRESTRGFGRRAPYILHAVETIRREACNGLTAAALASRMPGSRRHFEFRFREAMGHSVLDEIQSVQLDRVCTLLAETDTPVEAIADFCGFGSGRTLRDLFRARMGCSMREYRARNRG